MILRFDIIQNTEEWEIIKYHKFSASTCAALLMDKKNKGYQDLIDKIVEEKRTGQKSESKTWQGNYTTDRGHEFEPVAREDYERRTFNEITIIGVIELNDWVLCSPDGIINYNGDIDNPKFNLHQIKCPIFNTQKKYLKKVNELREKGFDDNGILYKIDSGYYKQEQFELYVSGCQYAVWTSYHPNLPPIDLKIKRDENMISDIKNRIREARREVMIEIEYIESY